MEKNKSFAELYLDSSFFKDEANQTIGAPLVGNNLEKLVKNRRSVSSKLTKNGQDRMTEVLSSLEIALGMRIVAKWSRYCGCSMCPCSPGFRISAKKIDSYSVLRSEDRFSIWIKENGRVEVREPKYNVVRNENFVKKVLSVWK